MQVIMITRVYAMYQRSRKILVFLIVIFMAVQIPLEVIYLLSNKTSVVAGKLRL
jgi:hypothetical protein